MGAADNDPLLTGRGAWGFLEVLRVFLSVFLIFFFFQVNWTIKRVQFRKLDDRFDSLFNERVNGLYFFFPLFVIMVALIVFSIEHVLRMLGIYVFEWMRYVRLMINRIIRASFRRDEFFSRDFFEEREERDDKREEGIQSWLPPR